MRRRDKKIEEFEDIENILREATVCRIGMCKDGSPYVVPVCFGYKKGAIYVHSASEGRKIDILKNNNRICFEAETDVEVLPSASVCKWSMRYRCVIGFGRAFFLENEEEKREAMDVIIEKYSGNRKGENYKKLENVAVIKIVIDSISGKRSGF